MSQRPPPKDTLGNNLVVGDTYVITAKDTGHLSPRQVMNLYRVRGIIDEQSNQYPFKLIEMSGHILEFERQPVHGRPNDRFGSLIFSFTPVTARPPTPERGRLVSPIVPQALPGAAAAPVAAPVAALALPAAPRILVSEPIPGGTRRKNKRRTNRKKYKRR